MPIEAVATEKQRKNLSTIEDDDLAEEARRGILEKYKSKSSPHLLADSYLPLASSSPRNKENSRQQDAGKLMYSSEAQVNEQNQEKVLVCKTEAASQRIRIKDSRSFLKILK